MQATGNRTAAMPGGADGAQPGGMRALLAWWALAGADVLVGEQPRPWFDEQPQEAQQARAEKRPAPPARPARAPGSRTASAAPEAAPRDGWWDKATSLAELAAAFRQHHPALPFATGSANVRLMFLAAAPTPADIESSAAFSGREGQLFDNMLAAIGLRRADTYGAYLAPRYAGGGAPTPTAIADDRALTAKHLALAAPAILVLLGGAPARALATAADDGAAASRWRTVAIGGETVPALATFGLSYLLQRPQEKARVWADLLQLKRRLGR